MIALLAEASIFAGRYRIGRCIASGGMGAVYEVEHVETERRAALKVLLPHVLANETARERFKAEAKVAARLRSEHVVDILDAGVDEATAMPYLVMELLEGEDLGARLRRLGPFRPEDAVLCLDQIARALDRLHARSIVHRDLKPENLFLTSREDGSPLLKVLDFGIAKELASGASTTDQARGTPIYMAPEQFKHAGPISPAADIYSLGLVAYTLLAGDAYWSPELDQGTNVFAIGRLAEAGPQEPASQRARARGVELPPAFDGWFAQMTSLDPEARFSRATEAVQALASSLGVTLPARAEERPSLTGHPDSRPVPSARRAHEEAPTLSLHELATQAAATADTETDRSSVLDARPRPSGAELAGSISRPIPKAPRGGVVIGALLAVAIVVAAIALTQRSPDPRASAAASAPPPSATAPAATSEVTVAPALLPVVLPSTASPDPTPPPPSASASSPAPPAPTTPANVASSPAAAASTQQRPKEVPAGPAAPAKKPKYTQD